MVTFTQIPDFRTTTVQGTAGDDVLSGYTGNDTLIGGAGDDIFMEGIKTWGGFDIGGFVVDQSYNFGQGNDDIQGGVGDDWLYYGGRAGAAVLDLTARTVIFGGAERDTFSGIEAITLGYGADRVTGVQAGIWLDLAQGNDTLSGVSGFSLAYGGTGRDLLDYSAATAAVTVDLSNNVGAFGAQVFEFEDVTGAVNAVNFVTGDDLSNKLTGGNQADTFDGQGGNDGLYGGYGGDTIAGDDGDDLLDGGSGFDVLWGGAGNDTIMSGPGGGFMDGGVGNDSLTGNFEADTITGDLGDDAIYGGSGNDSILGGDGNDLIWGGAGRNILDGGTGDDTIYGGDWSEVIFGGTAAATDGTLGIIDAGAGNDTVTAYGTGQVWLGAGDDVLLYAPGNNPQQVWGDDGNDRISLYLGTAAGGLGNDTISVTTGSAIGGIGNDSLTVGLNGSADGGDGDDVVTYSHVFARKGDYAAGGAGDDTIVLGKGGFLVTAAEVAPDSIGRANVFGFEQIQVLAGAAQAIDDYIGLTGLDLGAGNDGLRAEVAGTTYLLGDGNDTGYAYAANVTFWGGAGMDTFSVYGAGAVIHGEGGNDYVSLVAQAVVDTGSGNDQITLNDTDADLTGTVISTGSGDDLIWAYRQGGSINLGAGSDWVNVYLNTAYTGSYTGGAGADTFVFAKAGTSTITDFNVAQDHLGIIGVARVSDLDSVTTEAGGLLITEGALKLHLAGLNLGDLTDAVFVAAVYHG